MSLTSATPEFQEDVMRDTRRPTFHSLQGLPMLAYALDGQLVELQQQRRNLEAARARPGSMNDAVLDRVLRVLGETGDMLELYAQQVEHWRCCAPSPTQEIQVEHVGQQVILARETVSAILALAAAMKSCTIEAAFRQGSHGAF